MVFSGTFCAFNQGRNVDMSDSTSLEVSRTIQPHEEQADDTAQREAVETSELQIAAPENSCGCHFQIFFGQHCN